MARCKRSAKPFKQGIAGGVAVRSLTDFQAIEIHEQHSERPAVALRAADFLREALFAGAAIVKSRELIERGELVDLRGQRFHLGEGLHLVGDLVVHAA